MMAAVLLRLLLQVAFGMAALVALLWQGFIGKGWLAGFVYAIPLCLMAEWFAPSPWQMTAWREFMAQQREKSQEATKQ